MSAKPGHTQEGTNSKAGDAQEAARRLLYRLGIAIHATDGDLEAVLAYGAERERLARLEVADMLRALPTEPCPDPGHDIRWCQTCEMRIDGIEKAELAVRALMEAK